MADIFISYKRADRNRVAPLVARLEASGWSVWWDTRLAAGEHWDEVIEREIAAARCVAVVWSVHSVDRVDAYWVHLEAHHGRERGILVPIMIDNVPRPFSFSLIQARDLSARDETSLAGFVADVRRMLDAGAVHAPQPAPSMPPVTNDAEREWHAHDLDKSDDPQLLKAYAVKWSHADVLWAYKARRRAQALEAKAVDDQRHVQESHSVQTAQGKLPRYQYAEVILGSVFQVIFICVLGLFNYFKNTPMVNIIERTLAVLIILAMLVLILFLAFDNDKTQGREPTSPAAVTPTN